MVFLDCFYQANPMIGVSIIAQSPVLDVCINLDEAHEYL